MTNDKLISLLSSVDIELTCPASLRMSLKRKVAKALCFDRTLELGLAMGAVEQELSEAATEAEEDRLRMKSRMLLAQCKAVEAVARVI